MSSILNASVAGLFSSLGETGIEMITVSDGTVTLLSPDSSPYPPDSILYSIEDEGSRVYILPADSVVLSIDHTGPIEIDRFFASTPGIVTSYFYQVGAPQTLATTMLDTTHGLGRLRRPGCLG